MPETFPYLPGSTLNESGLLSRFLPPIPENLISSWKDERIRQGSFIFDPFGTSPDLLVQVALAGNRVLTCVNNPIARFLISLAATPPTEEDFRSALAELARSRVGEERLELHLVNMYQTNCSQCGNPVIAQAFIWEKEARTPQSKIYECKICGDSGEHPVTQTDIHLSSNFPATSMHRMRIMERISQEDKIRKNLADALSVYQPRALYGLITLINRLESLLASTSPDDSVDPTRNNCLIALVLYALDYGNNLWSYPSGRSRPKQLSSSPVFRENNLWHILETAVIQLPRQHETVEICIYPEMPQEKHGICVFEGPLRNLNEVLISTDLSRLPNVDGIITAIPRHNQAYWTLSALWAGWLWGRDTLGDFKSVLLRRRYDWGWHCAALNSAFRTIKEIIKQKTPVIGLIPEAESGFVQAAIIAAGKEGFILKGISLRADKQFAQVHWDYAPKTDVQIAAPLVIQNQTQDMIVNTSIAYLEQRGETAPYLSLHANSLINIASHDGISKERSTASAEEYSRIQRLIEGSLSYKHGFIRQGGSEKSFENAILWHQEINNPDRMLSDRIEEQIRQKLNDRVEMNFQSLDEFICRIFPGMLTPNLGLVTHCVDSYCNKEQLKSNIIVLREQDKPGLRSLEVASNCLALCDLGDKLGFAVEGENPVIWKYGDGVSYIFYVIATAEIGEIVFRNSHPPGKSILVVPGARSNLLLYKIRNNFQLSQVIEQGWRFLKFRHLRHLLDSPTLNKSNLDIELNLDPLTETPAQMRLL